MASDPNITLSQLAVMRAVVRTGSVTHAARDLFRTQSAVTQQIRLLERELGCSLFVHRGRHIEPTPEGREVARRAEEICGQVDRLKSAMAKRCGEVQGLLRIGCGSQTANRILPTLLSAFVRQYPRVDFEVVETQSDLLVRMLLDGHIDVGLGQHTALPRQVAFEKLFEDPFVFVSSRRHPMARAGRVGLKDLAGLPLIQYRHGSMIQSIIESHLRDMRLAPVKGVEVTSTESALTLVRRDLGVALVPRYIVQLLKPKGVAAIPFDPCFTLEYGLYRLRRRFAPPAQNAFLAYVKNHGREALGAEGGPA